MKKAFSLCALIVLMACAPPIYRMVYSPGFSFAKYDFMVMSKPDGPSTSASLYSMDVELANLISRYNIKIIGDKEFEKMTEEQKRQTLFARMAMISNSESDNLISVSLDDALTGKTVASLSVRAHGDMFDPAYRTDALESLSIPLIQALQRDKGIVVKDQK